MRPRLTYANVMATIAVFIALGSGAYAAKQLPKNSVGTKQLKKNAVTKVKIKKNSVNGPKVKKNSLTGADINLSKLGTVPSAKSANTAGSANTATTAGTANIANSLPPSEGWHEIGAPGEPGFENAWVNVPMEGLNFESAAFYKDHEGVVHMKGFVTGGINAVIFHLPPGYRPASGRILGRLTLCGGGACTDPTALMLIGGSGIPLAGFDGAVTGPGYPGSTTSLEGISFRAES